MKNNSLQLLRSLFLILILTGIGSVFSQVPARPDPSATLRPIKSEPAPQEARFDLNFPGGTVVEFVEAVGQAQGQPVNVVISEADRDTLIPRVSMHQVSVISLFDAISAASRTYNRDNSPNEGYAFSSVERNPTTALTWVFIVYERRNSGPRAGTVQVKFYNLEPLLNAYTVEDITTALNTGYQLRAGTTERLNLKFHKETKLLIVRGTLEELALIDDALRQLRPPEPPKPKLESKAPKSSVD